MTALLAQLAYGKRVTVPVALVVAHPDDETIGIGSRLAALRRLTIVHLTDGAPRSLDDARRAGFADAAAYAAARERELGAALAVLGASAAKRIAYRCPDQESIEHLDATIDRLVIDLADVDAVITHPYEHGHPDHDTAALAVALACRRIAVERGDAPARFEFASYHLRDGGPAYGEFWPDPTRRECRVDLAVDALAAKHAAVACHASQSQVLARFPLRPERLRVAPDYDFAAPAPPHACLYDGFGWEMTSAHWRAAAARAWRTLDDNEGRTPWSAAVAATGAR